MKLQDRSAIITGARGAIGSAVARTFAEEGADLCLADMDGAPELAAELVPMARRIIDVPTDITRIEQVRAMVAAAIETFGRVDIIVNVAGTVSAGSAETLEEPEWDRVLAVNLKGTFLCCQAALKPMRARHYGRIVNIGSILAKNGGNARPWLDRSEQSTTANVAYGVSKAGVHALTLYLAKELAADGITVNAVAPGPIASRMTTAFPQRLREMIPMGRVGTADEVAQACLFLAAETSGFVTGEILDVNGGMWMD